MKEASIELFRETKPDKQEKVYLVLAGIFLGSLVLTNVIAGKFFTIQIPFTEHLLSLSCGVIAYPVTFLVTDVIAEIYGKARAHLLVKAGFVVSIFVVFILLVASWAPIAPESYVSETSFNAVFGLTPGIVFGSMIAYLTAQFVDVKLFEFWRHLTKGKHLWLRNNGSTVLSQLIDTSLVVIIALVLYPSVDGIIETEPISWKLAGTLIIGQYLFKAFIALCDTPFIYGAVYGLKRYFGWQS